MNQELHPLRAAREHRGLSAKGLSQLSGVDEKTISRIENGHRLVWGQSLMKLARVLRVQTHEIVREGQASERALNGIGAQDHARAVACVWLGLDPTKSEDVAVALQLKNWVAEQAEAEGEEVAA
jgi:transcriptional regulator with XRE-family HTH domain